MPSSAPSRTLRLRIGTNIIMTSRRRAVRLLAWAKVVNPPGFFNAEALGRDGTAGARRGGKGTISTVRRIRIYLIRILRRTWTRLGDS